MSNSIILSASAILDENIFSDLQFEPSKSYIIVSIIISAILGLCALGFLLFSSFVQRRHKVLGIVTGVFQLVGFITSTLFVILFNKLDFDLIMVTDEKFLDASMKYINDHMTLIAIFAISSLLMLASFIVSTVYFVKLIKGQGGKAFTIIALVSHVASFMILSPLNNFSAVPTEKSQIIYDIFYRIVCLTPSVLTFISSLILYKKWKRGEISLDEPINTGFNPYADPFFTEPLQTNFYPNNPTSESTNKLEYTVILKSVGFHKLDVVQIIKEVLDISMDEARFLALESPLPNTIAKDVPKGIATELELRLTNAGAKVELV